MLIFLPALQSVRSLQHLQLVKLFIALAAFRPAPVLLTASLFDRSKSRSVNERTLYNSLQGLRPYPIHFAAVNLQVQFHQLVKDSVKVVKFHYYDSLP